MGVVASFPARPDLYLERVDAHLATLPDVTARQDFLTSLLDGWMRRYARFICTEGRSEPHVRADDPPHSTDFLLTIAGISTRLHGEPA